jgi:chemotaxis methyl-accepting protein methylase
VIDSSSVQVARGSRFRHVIFKGIGGGRRHAVNLAPRDTRFPHRPPEYWSPVPQLEPDEARFVAALFERGGLDAVSYRHETIRRRLPACLRVFRAATANDAMTALRDADPATLAAALDAMVIGVTGFFRDATVFRYLRESALPMLPRTGGRPRIWSAGSSDGEELYSVAMLLAECNKLFDAYLLGTDCRVTALDRARDARYDARTLRDVSPQRLDAHFIPAGGEAHRIREHIRASVQWRRGDVTRVCEPGSFDVILCRNLAMYLTPDVAGDLWQQLENALRPGGFLVLGKAERPVGARRLTAVAPCVYRRRSA